ncbi:ATP-binding protein [Rhizobium leguminosarum]|uniref:ATP-binding protein n=1 Tax=Rhizobium leguminosarum TaxID=384 RepID=UPI0013EE76E3|nr:ATP-binding protein [Rhizobium leguminosarum]
MELVQSIGEIGARFLEMRISHPLSDDAFKQFDLMRETKRRSKPDTEQPGGTFFADSAYGKSTIVRMYLETRVVDDCLARRLFREGTPRDVVLKEQKLVIYVSLPPATKMKALVRRLLRALGDPRPGNGDLEDQIERAKLLMLKHGTELLIIDEIDHLRVPQPKSVSRKDEANSVQNHLKDLLIAGIPIMFVGIPEAKAKLFNERQIGRRSFRNVKSDVLKYEDDVHFQLILGFCADLGIILQEKGIMRDRSDFISGDTLPCLFEAGGKLLGGIVKVVWRAAEIAFEEYASSVTRAHLLAATDDASVPFYCTYNPFREGTRSVGSVRGVDLDVAC